MVWTVSSPQAYACHGVARTVSTPSCPYGQAWLGIGLA
ncbi:hypothetical protein SACS_0392 [Parasaccharibacter apium]|uniref:Uncharacterized protein n=1 Tax=Parasaccharibacter apium TaxID=1510841 RepID=A0A7U7G4S7_9PROT|nr:hypothetical protein SACS_0392 [Parasaccharibacter apium]